ncbi:MAG: restriction endonuclease subunit S [Desulfurellaceae bacterium]|nr:restriction endonuclease subunit S [Desulfurellaceae bacterium]
MSISVKKIGEIATVKGGKRLPKGKSVLDGPTAHPYLRVVDFADDGIDRSNLKYIDEETFEAIKRYTIQAGDVYISIAGTIGRVGIVPEDLSGASLTENAAKITNFSDEVDHRYLMCFLRGSVGQGQIANLTGGTSQPKLALYRIAEIGFPFPPLPTQKRVSEIISAYDTLIENNRRRIQLLEQAARLLYKEWFVRLRFPGYEHVRVKDGVPEGWERRTAFEVMDVLSGGTPKTSVPSYWGDDIPFFTPKDATDCLYTFSTERTLTEDGLRNCSSRLYPKDTLFITARGTVGKLTLAQTDMAMNQTCYALIAQPPLNQHFLYFALVEGVEQFRSRAVGSVFDAIIRDTFRQIPFLVPDESVIRMFSNHVTPMIRQIDALSHETRKLAQARELLLPRLMSGDGAGSLIVVDPREIFP